MRKLISIFAASFAGLLAGSAVAASDPLLTMLEESKSSGRGLNLYVGGQPIAAVVVSVEDRYVVARSQAQGKIVIRLDRIDGAAGFVGQPVAERKP